MGVPFFALFRLCSWLDPVPGLEAILTGEDHSVEAYATYIKSAIPHGAWELIRSAVRRGQLTGEGRFVEEVRTITGRRIEHREFIRNTHTEVVVDR